MPNDTWLPLLLLPLWGTPPLGGPMGSPTVTVKGPDTRGPVASSCNATVGTCTSCCGCCTTGGTA